MTSDITNRKWWSDSWCIVAQLCDPKRIFALCVLCYRLKHSRGLYVSIQNQHEGKSDRYVCVCVWWSIEREGQLQASPTVSRSIALLVWRCGGSQLSLKEYTRTHTDTNIHTYINRVQLIQRIGKAMRDKMCKEWISSQVKECGFWFSESCALNLLACFITFGITLWRRSTWREQCAVMKPMEHCQPGANQLCSRHIEIIHCSTLKAVEAWVQHRIDFLCIVLGSGIISAWI